MKISLVTPVGRRYCVWELLQTVKFLIKSNPEITFFWVIYDNSNHAGMARMFENQRKLFKERFPNIEDIVIHTDKEKWFECYEKGVSTRIQTVYNTSFALCPESDYGMSIEDDITLFHPNALKIMLAQFDETTGTVFAPTYARRLNKIFHVPPQVWTAGKLPPDTAEVKDSGVTIEDYVGQTFWVARWDLIKKLGFEPSYKGLNGNDRVWCLKTKELGYVTKVCWDLKPKHWYLSSEGIMGYTSWMVAKRLSKFRGVLIKTDRKASPQFISANSYDAPKWGWGYWLKI